MCGESLTVDELIKALEDYKENHPNGGSHITRTHDWDDITNIYKDETYSPSSDSFWCVIEG